jgi:tetraacyldisaccharide 4'-kinase
MGSVSFDIPLIGLGNLSTGGTGKTPHTEYIAHLLKNEFKVGIVSRGYRRKTKDYLEVQSTMTHLETGDEPLQMKVNLGDEVKIAVESERLKGITRLLTEHFDRDVVLLDDCYQHRAVKPGIQILLSDYQNPFYKDRLLPMGNLREHRSGFKRADAIIISKCPEDLPVSEILNIENQINKTPEQKLYFTKFKYAQPRFVKGEAFDIENKKALLLTGIAKAEYLVKYLNKKKVKVKHLEFPDHYRFRNEDLRQAQEKNGNFDADILLTTEKDWMRIKELKLDQYLADLPIAYIPISVQFVKKEEEFKNWILNYVRKNKDNHRLPEDENEN